MQTSKSAVSGGNKEDLKSFVAASPFGATKYPGSLSILQISEPSLLQSAHFTRPLLNSAHVVNRKKTKIRKQKMLLSGILGKKKFDCLYENEIDYRIKFLSRTTFLKNFRITQQTCQLNNCRQFYAFEEE